jgi:hypothetical protein
MLFCVAAIDNVTWSCGFVFLLLIMQHGHVAYATDNVIHRVFRDGIFYLMMNLGGNVSTCVR